MTENTKSSSRVLPSTTSSNSSSGNDNSFPTLDSIPERRSLAQEVHDRLKQLIMSNELSPGTKVVESQVAKTMQISRTPVREAIQRLQNQGFLRQSYTGAYFVVGFTNKDIQEIFGIRGVLESYAARLAAEQYQKGDLSSLEEKIEEYQELLDQGKFQELSIVNTEFHDLLYNLSKSPRLIKMINNLREQIYYFREVILYHPEMARKSNIDHRAMVEAIKNKDSNGVEHLVWEHIMRGKEIVLQEFGKQNQNN